MLADQQWDMLITVILIVGLVISVHKPGLHVHQLSDPFTTCGVGRIHFLRDGLPAKNCKREELLKQIVESADFIKEK
jgi:hypothetical protein